MQYQIPLLPPDISKEVQEGFRAGLDTATLSPSASLEKFHQAVQPFFTDHAVLGLSSCTAALHLGLRLLGVKAGDRVLCPTFTFAATVNAILYLQAVPVFIDSEEDSWNMDPALTDQALRDLRQQEVEVGAIIVVHANGTPAKLEQLMEIAAAYQVPLLEDAAAAFGSLYKGAMAGTFGKLGAYSFNYNKLITTAGGGLLVSRDPELINEADYLANQARVQAPYYQHDELGYNYRMNGMAAELGVAQFAYFQHKLYLKKTIRQQYVNSLEGVGGITFQQFPEESVPNCWLSSFLLPEEKWKKKIFDTLQKQGIECRMLWRPMHYQPAYRDFKVYNRGCAENLFNLGLSLPSAVALTESQQQEVIEQVRRCF